MHTPRLLVPAMALLLALVAGLLHCGGPGGPPPNLILITLDTTRADHLGCYGHSKALTPVLDSLAAAGTLFEHAMTCVPLTLPSHATILTGLSPLKHGIQDNGTFVLAEEFTTVAEHLRAANYQTGAFVSAFVLSDAYGTQQGFTTYDDRFYNERSAQQTSLRAARWLDRIDPARPFFLWLHYYDPHLPFRPPEPYRSMEHMHPYDQEIAAMDASIGWFVHQLAARGMLAQTDFVIAGDHGEGLGDHGEIEHGVFLYDATLRVPLMVVLHDGRGAGERCPDLTTTEDIAPTLLELAGLAPPDEIDGVSLLTRVDGGQPTPERAGYAETYFPEYNFYYSHTYALCTEEWKYISAPRPELYDLSNDPAELEDLYAARRGKAESLKTLLDEHRRAAQPEGAAGNTLSPEEIERLQSLGYLGGGQVAVEMEASGEFVLPDPKDLGPYVQIFSKGLEALNAGRLEQAQTLLEQVLAHNPENIIVRLNLGKLHMQLGRGQAAVEQLEQAVILAPKSGTCRKFLGMAYQQVGRYRDAIATFRLIDQHPTQGLTASMEIARTQLMQGDAEGARLSMRQLVDRAGGSAMFQQMERRITAYLDAEVILAHDPNNERVRLDLAGAALDLRLLDQADAALVFTGSTPLIEAQRHQLLGSIAGARGDYATALTEFEATFPELRHDNYIRAQLTGLYLDAGRPGDALAMADELIRAGQVNPVLYYNKACALVELGRREEAFTALHAAIKIGYDNLKNLQEDPDLEPLRQDPRYLELVELATDVTES